MGEKVQNEILRTVYKKAFEIFCSIVSTFWSNVSSKYLQDPKKNILENKIELKKCRTQKQCMNKSQKVHFELTILLLTFLHAFL